MVKNVHTLKVLTLQENLAKADKKIFAIQKSTKHEMSELKKQVDLLNKEKSALRKSSSVHEKIWKLKDLQNVSNTLTGT